jgi:excinuclease ABC subunit C
VEVAWLELSRQQAVSTPAASFDSLPQKPGVYVLRNASGIPVYVGKATSIRSRVFSHLRPTLPDPVGQALKDQIQSADYIITETPIEALILENNLIKRYKPRYNIRLKDDKSYPFIKITNELYPRVFVTRGVKDDGAKYFGPYGNVRAAKRSVKYLRRLFPIRSCTLPLDGVKKFKSCLDYSIGLCKAPCIFAVSKEEYDSDTSKFQLFLQGKLVELSKQMYSEMWKYSEAQDFEKASRVRDEIRALETTALKQRIVFPNQKRDKDVLTIAREGRITAAIIFQVRNGKVIGRDKFILEGANLAPTDSEILSAFIKQYYGPNTSLALEMPEEIVIPFELQDLSEVRLLLDSRLAKRRSEDGDSSGNQSKGIKISCTPESEENKLLLKLAQENADLVLKEEESRDEVRKRERLHALKELKELLNLDRIPRRIECYDISNIHGEEAVGAMTVFLNGFPEKGQYRKFKIKTVSQIDDYSMMAEVIGRRFRRLLKSPSDPESARSFDEPPNLIVIDGGRGQLNAAVAQMRRDGVFGIPTVALAKKEELIFVPKKSFPIRLSRDSEALHILQHIRDEAHRFGITYHRNLRERKITESQLDLIVGIGETRKRNLLSHFGSVEAIKNSSPDEIAQAGNVSKKIASVILASLNK